MDAYTLIVPIDTDRCVGRAELAWTMLTALECFLFLFQVGWFTLVGYLLLLTAAALRADQRTKLEPGRPAARFAILVPAHNEERLLPDLMASLAHLDYPVGCFRVYVVADNCTDNTAAIAERGGAKVYVRTNHEQRGKGYALNWLLREIQQDGEHYEAFVILDADSIVSKNFLQVMSNRLARGERAIQAYYTVRNPERSLNGGLRFLALAALHYLRPQARMVLGGSVGLKGNGMVLASDLLEKYEWSPAVTEDIEFHMALILGGERVTFASDAVVWGEMPDSFAQSNSQQARWESGRIEMARKYTPILIEASWKALRTRQWRRAFFLFDAVLEHLIPPFAVFTAISLAFLAADVALFFSVSSLSSEAHADLAITNLVIGTSILFGQLVYLLTALRLANAPASIYIKLLFTPIYMVWKIRQYFTVLIGQKQQIWVRTYRNEG